MFNFLKKILSIFLIFNLTFVSSAQAAATFVQNLSVRHAGEGSNAKPRGIAFNNDGTKMFIADEKNDASDIDEYSLSTAYDISTATLVDSLNIPEDRTTMSVKFNNDGSKMFIGGRQLKSVTEYLLPNNFDLTGATFETRFDVTELNNLFGLDFNNDGTMMYITGNGSSGIYQYSLNVGFDLSKGVTFLHSKGLATAASSDGTAGLNQEVEPFGIEFNPDGTRAFIIGTRSNGVDEYALSTAFDISTLSHVDFLSLSSDEPNPSGIAFNKAGTKMFIVGDSHDEVNEYILTCPFKVTSSSTCYSPLKDKDVTGIIDAQINTAKNFANDSSQSALKRLTILRANKGYSTTVQKIDLLFQNELFNKISNNVLSSTPAKKTLSQQLRQLQKNLPEDWALWTEGSISFGKIGDSFLSSAQDIDSLGITVGVDTKMDNDQILGVALRVGNTDVDVGTFGSKVDTNALSLSVYGSNSLDNRNFLKHVLGLSYLDSEILRVNEENTDKHAGDREGRQVFGSLNIGREYENDDVTFSPTVRIDGSYTTLNGYREDGVAALSYNDQDIKSLMASLGVLIDEDFNLENSTVKHRFNLEYGKEFTSNSKVVTSYVTDSEIFEYQADNKNRDIYTAGFGFDFKHDQGLTISTDYERQQIKGHGHVNKFTLSTGFLYRKETELALGLSEDMTSNFKISKALDGFDLVFDLENDFSNQENHNANLSLLSKF